MTQQEVIKAFMKSLDKTSKTGAAALDEAIRKCSPFKSFEELKAALIRDCKKAKSADDFLKTYCGIDYSTADNGAITGSDAGGSTSKNDENLIPESGKLKTYKKSSFKVNGLTVKLGDNKTDSQLSTSEKFIWQGLYTWWIKGALDLIAESYGDNFSFTNKSSATTKELYVQFVNLNDNWLAYSWSTYNNELVLSINMNYYGGYNKNSVDEANSSFDILIAHELTHSVMDANINKKVYEPLPAFVKEGLAVLTTGVTDDSIIKTLAADPSEFENGLDLNKISIGKFESSHFPYEGGFTFFRYLARQAGDLTVNNTTANKTVQTFYGNDTVKNYADKVSVSSGAGNDYIENYGSKVKIYGGAGNDTIWNGTSSNSIGGAKVTISGGKGNDYIVDWGAASSIFGGAGNDSIWGDKGNDTIKGDAGNDKIFGGSGNDKLYGGTGKDLIMGDTGNDTLLGGKGNDSLWGGSGKDTFIYKAGEGTDTIFDYEKGDMLKIVGGSFKSSKYSGGTLTLAISGGGKVIFEDVAKGDKFNINGTTYKISGSKLK